MSLVLICIAFAWPNSAAALDIRSETIAGETIHIGAGSDDRLQVVCFLGTECPLAKLYGPRLQQLADHLADQDVRFIGLFSNRQDTVGEIGEYLRDHDLRFPAIKDSDNRIADALGATRTPEVFVLDSDGQLRYRGRINDQYAPGVIRQQPTREDLRAALRVLLAGGQPDPARTEAMGCVIGRVSRGSAAPGEPLVTYSQEISRLLKHHCVECHRPGEIGPFALDTYDEVVGWGETILEAVEDGRMPPWHAGPPHDRFIGARAIDVDEIALLRKWVDQGMPEGDAADLPEPTRFVEGWDLPRKPDLQVQMSERPMRVPASGTVEYQYFVVDPGFQRDRWVSAAQVIPGNASVVHHAICFIRPPDGSPFQGVGWLGAYVPGQRSAVLERGHARRIPAGSKLVFQMHYTPTGKPETDITRVGMVFADPDSVTHEVMTLLAINQSFEIPPGEARHHVVATRDRFPPGAQLLSIMPHMHYRGFACSVDVVRGDRQQRLLDVPRYDFNWQHDYRLVDPLNLDEVDRLEFTAVFDNSERNPWNPDPTRTVTWGDQTWEEMAVAFFDVAVPLSSRPAAGDSVGDDDEGVLDAATVAGRTRFVQGFFDRFDSNADGHVDQMETPMAFEAFGFSQFDADADGRLDRQEITAAATGRTGP